MIWLMKSNKELKIKFLERNDEQKKKLLWLYKTIFKTLNLAKRSQLSTKLKNEHITK